MDRQDKDFLVEIFAGKSDAEGEIATGYPIAKNRILTVRHALFSDDNEPHPIQVRWHYLKNSPAREWRPADIVWHGNSEFDIAVVECEFPDEVDHWGYPSAEPLQQNKFWASEGFARAGKRDDVRAPVPMGGNAYAPATSSLEFVLGNDAPVSGEDNWKGASGSPVFIEHKIMGVIVSCLKNFDARRLKATPMWQLLLNSGFCTAIRYDVRKERLELIRAGLFACLEQSPEALGKLSSGSESPGEVADQLLQLRPEALLRKAESAIIALKTAQKAAAIDTVREIVNIILPALFDEGVIQSVSTELQCASINLPVATRTVAEIIMAGLDRQCC